MDEVSLDAMFACIFLFVWFCFDRWNVKVMNVDSSIGILRISLTKQKNTVNVKKIRNIRSETKIKYGISEITVNARLSRWNFVD